MAVPPPEERRHQHQLTCRQRTAARSACTSDLMTSGSCAQAADTMRRWNCCVWFVTLLHRAMHRATSCSVSAVCTRTSCAKTHPLQEAAQACNVPAEDARRGSIISWRPHLLIIQGTCAAIRADENDPFVHWPCSRGTHLPCNMPSCQTHPSQQSRLPVKWIWTPCPPGGQGCFFWRFFLGGAGSSPSAPCSATAASAAASAAVLAAAAAVSLCQ